MKYIAIGGKRENFVSGALNFNGNLPQLNDQIPLNEFLENFTPTIEKYESVVIVDVDSFKKKFLNTDIVKEIKIKKIDTKYLTYIYNIDDIYDATCGIFSNLCVPLHTLKNMDVLKEGIKISDNMIPTIFSQYFDENIIEEIKKLGFDEYLYVDTTKCEFEMRKLVVELDSTYTILN